VGRSKGLTVGKRTFNNQTEVSTNVMPLKFLAFSGSFCGVRKRIRTLTGKTDLKRRSIPKIGNGFGKSLLDLGIEYLFGTSSLKQKIVVESLEYIFKIGR